MDKEKFKAAVFRRGNKQELLHPSTTGTHGQHDAEASLPDQLTGDEKLDELLKLWSLARSGYVVFLHAMRHAHFFNWIRIRCRKDLAAAIWRPSKCAAQVVLQKGRLFSHVGCLWGGHMYLTIEEAVYMVDRGSMLLFLEDGTKKRLLTMKECYALMETCGVSMDHFITYCKLLRAGYVAHRRGLPWVLKNKDEIRRCDCRFEETVENRRTRTSEVRELAPPVDTKRQKRKRTGEDFSGTMGEWWPEYHWHDEHAGKNLPTFEVVDEKTKEQRRLDLFPRMAPLASHAPNLGDSSSEQGMYLDVYPPNGNFSRKQPGTACSLLSMISCGENVPPSSEILEDLEPLMSSSDAKVRFVGVEHGDIAFYSFFRTTLRDIH